MPLISATIITRNEAQHIGRAIRSLSVADEIVVVDAESTDETRDVAASLRELQGAGKSREARPDDMGDPGHAKA